MRLYKELLEDSYWVYISHYLENAMQVTETSGLKQMYSKL